MPDIITTSHKSFTINLEKKKENASTKHKWKKKRHNVFAIKVYDEMLKIHLLDIAKQIFIDAPRALHNNLARVNKKYYKSRFDANFLPGQNAPLPNAGDTKRLYISTRSNMIQSRTQIHHLRLLWTHTLASHLFYIHKIMMLPIVSCKYKLYIISMVIILTKMIPKEKYEENN